MSVTSLAVRNAPVIAALLAGLATSTPDRRTTAREVYRAAHARATRLARRGAARIHRVSGRITHARWFATVSKAEWPAITHAIATIANCIVATHHSIITRLIAAILATGRARARRSTAARPTRLTGTILARSAIAARRAVVRVLAASTRARIVGAAIAVVTIGTVLAFAIDTRINRTAHAVIAILGLVLTCSIHARVFGTKIAVVARFRNMYAAIPHARIRRARIIVIAAILAACSNTGSGQRAFFPAQICLIRSATRHEARQIPILIRPHGPGGVFHAVPVAITIPNGASIFAEQRLFDPVVGQDHVIKRSEAAASRETRRIRQVAVLVGPHRPIDVFLRRRIPIGITEICRFAVKRDDRLLEPRVG